MLVIHLVSKSGKGAYRLINFMLDMAGGGHMQEEVQQACSLILVSKCLAKCFIESTFIFYCFQ